VNKHNDASEVDVAAQVNAALRMYKQAGKDLRSLLANLKSQNETAQALLLDAAERCDELAAVAAHMARVSAERSNEAAKIARELMERLEVTDLPLELKSRAAPRPPLPAIPPWEEEEETHQGGGGDNPGT
jgi:hypothetical protein